MKIKELKTNETAIMDMLLMNVVERETKTRKPFLTLTLTDGEDTVDAIIWEMSLSGLSFDFPSVVSVQLKAELYNGVISYKVGFVRESSADIRNFIHKAPAGEKEFKELISIADSFDDQDVKNLVMYILTAYKEDFCRWSAAKSMHHNLYGGLLYHTYRMTKLAEKIAEVYRDANRDYLIGGTILHDIGKLKELDSDDVGVAAYSVDGTLLGHSYIGMRMVEEAGKDLKISDEVIRNITHIIASHHGELEYGAITKPATLEAMLVHEIDMIDSRAYMFEEAEKDMEPGTVAEKVYGIGNVYKPL